MDQTVIKARLDMELTKIIEELKTIAVQSPDTGDWVAIPDTDEMGNADENVTADTVEDWDTKRATLASLETRYRDIVRALDKISAGTYGVCEISGETIETERLEANPTARTNIANRDRERELPL